MGRDDVMVGARGMCSGLSVDLGLHERTLGPRGMRLYKSLAIVAGSSTSNCIL